MNDSKSLHLKNPLSFFYGQHPVHSGDQLKAPWTSCSFTWLLPNFNQLSRKHAWGWGFRFVQI